MSRFVVYAATVGVSAGLAAVGGLYMREVDR